MDNIPCQLSCIAPKWPFSVSIQVDEVNGNMLGKVKRTHSQILMLLLHSHSLERPYFLSIHDYNLVHHRVIAEL